MEGTANVAIFRFGEAIDWVDRNTRIEGERELRELEVPNGRRNEANKGTDEGERFAHPEVSQRSHLEKSSKCGGQIRNLSLEDKMGNAVVKNKSYIKYPLENLRYGEETDNIRRTPKENNARYDKREKLICLVGICGFILHL